MQVQKHHPKTITLQVALPLLPGSLSTAWSTCGKPYCACKAKPPQLHGVYYRWTGFVQGQRTTRTLTKAQAQECQRRIKNYRRLQKQIEQILALALRNAPWNEGGSAIH